jgi:cation:H+ antiporter
MIADLLWIALSLVLLFIGAEGLVRGSASLALRLGLTPLVIGLTVVAYGTSTPEMIVSTQAALTGQGDIALGNVIGSNIFNIGIILGLAAVVCPINVQFQLIKLDAPIMIGVSLLLVAVIGDGALSRAESAGLLAGVILYTIGNLWLARREANKVVEKEYDDSMPVRSRNVFIDIGFILGGLGILILGSRLLVDNSISLARDLGVSEAVIGLTIVAAGTSMPELATSVLAALRKQPDIAIGNVIGSNIFNILAILGVSGLVAPLQAPGISHLDLGVMVAFAIGLFPLLYTGLKVRRIEGVLLLAGYVAYLAVLWPKS